MVPTRVGTASRYSLAVRAVSVVRRRLMTLLRERKFYYQITCSRWDIQQVIERQFHMPHQSDRGVATWQSTWQTYIFREKACGIKSQIATNISRIFQHCFCSMMFRSSTISRAASWIFCQSPKIKRKNRF